VTEFRGKSELEEALDAPFTFAARPRPVLGSLRPTWRIPTILMLIRRCWGGKASLEQLHVLNWAVRDSRSQGTFLSFIQGEMSPDDAIVRFEPALNRALDFALAQKLVTWTDAKRLTLTNEGLAVLASVDAEEDLLTGEKSFLDQIGTPVSQTMIHRLIRRTS